MMKQIVSCPRSWLYVCSVSFLPSFWGTRIYWQGALPLDCAPGLWGFPHCYSLLFCESTLPSSSLSHTTLHLPSSAAQHGFLWDVPQWEAIVNWKRSWTKWAMGPAPCGPGLTVNSARCRAVWDPTLPSEDEESITKQGESPPCGRRTGYSD